MGLVTKPLVVAALAGVPDGLFVGHDDHTHRTGQGWSHETRVWYRLGLVGAGAFGGLSGLLDTDTSTTLALCGVTMLGTLVGKKVANPSAAFGDVVAAMPPALDHSHRTLALPPPHRQRPGAIA